MPKKNKKEKIKKSNKKGIIIFSILIVIIIFLISFFVASHIYLSPVDEDSSKTVEFVVEDGWGKNKIADELEKAGLIKSAFFFKLYIRLNLDKELYAGTYDISKSMDVNDIITLINSGNSVENETISITFIEGKRLTDYVSQISENFDMSESDIMAKLSDTDYLNSLIDKYWFLTDDILNEDIYYPLEGYLFPDTYTFKKSATLDEIINKMLANMESKLDVYKDEITGSNYTIHQLITLASIVELEGANSDDRAGIAGVFYNRLTADMALGSDVTTYYAVNKTFSEDLTSSDLKSCNGYNTRGSCVTGLPVGPIASPSLASITATIEPESNDYYYFVTDKNGKTYFNKTYSEHASTISELKSEDLWYEY